MIASTKEHLRRIVLMSLSALVLLMGMIAFLHTRAGQRIPFVKEISTWLGFRCPADQVSAFQVDQLRKLAFAGFQAPSKPAMGLLLDRTTLNGAANWIHEKGLNCSQHLRSFLGNPTRNSGVIDVKTFDRQMDSVSIEYNFKDYLAKVTASYLPWSGVVLYEQYLSFEAGGG